ncbi:MAG: U32 family peptidase [Thaumarchaeota archaeon]|nr:U32 family peptidase [Nitrososphaerota archaeon]MCL5317856.1 U32 family peptidase [Nitrososphaerota archaeon]
MKLAVPCRFEFDLLERLNEINSKYETIHEVFGSIPASIIGHGRATAGIEYFGKVDMDHVKKFAEKAHSVGIQVNYLLNAQCLGNTEYTEDGRTEIMKYLESIYAANVDSVTIAIPLLADIIKREFPGLKVVVSVISEANNPHRVALWKKIGVDRINIDYDSNRDFKRLKSISLNANIDLELLLNDGCLFFCPFQKYHRVLSAHGSKTGTARKNYIDYCLLKCSIERTDNPGEIIRGPWIRPEDTEFYEKQFGIHLFKISGRYQPADWIVNVAEAYSRRSYEGNFMDLLSLTFPTLAAHRIIVPVMNEGQIVATPPKVYIDNKKLDRFFNHIVKIGGCGDDSQCEACRFCEKTAQEVVEIRDPKMMKGYNSSLKSSLDTLLKSPVEVDLPRR